MGADLEQVAELAVEALRALATTLEEALRDAPQPIPFDGIPLATTFRLPMLNLDKAWYEATRRYGPYNYHPARCEDWNLETGGNTDLGEPLVSPFSGQVLSAWDWKGSVGRVVQLLGLTADGEMVMWAGWHLQTMEVAAGSIVRVGEPIGTVGNADGYYEGAHLHEQIMIVGALGMPHPALFAGSDWRYKWQQPSGFYLAHGVDPDLVRRCTEWKEGPVRAELLPGTVVAWGAGMRVLEVARGGSASG